MSFSRAIFRWQLASLLAVSVLAACALAACVSHPPATVEATRWATSQQLVLVTIPDWNSDHGVLQTFLRDSSGSWQTAAAAQPVTIGRSGAGWGIGLHDPQPAGPIKREGDGRSPAGAFALGEAFGYADHVVTALPYAPMRASHWCVDVSGSPLYNRIVDADVVGPAAVAGATEPMRRDLHANGDQRYRLGFVIAHNTPGRPMGGSCIFAHLWQSPGAPTTGCTAMAPATMEALLAWLDPAQRPLFVLLPRSEYLRLRRVWGLPGIDPAT